DAGHHGLADRHRADTDAGVVAAVGCDLDLVALAVDGTHRLEDRTGRLYREAHDDVLSSRDAAMNAAGVVRQEFDRAVAHAHLVTVFLAAQRHRVEPGADLDALDGVDRHHRAGEVAIELVVDRLAEAGGDAARDHLDHRPGGRAGLTHPVEVI